MKQASERKEWCEKRRRGPRVRGTMERASLQDFVEC